MNRKANVFVSISTLAFVVALGPAVVRADESPTGQGGTTGWDAGTHGHHAWKGGHGPLGLLHSALHEDIGLTAEQRSTIAATLASARPGPPPADEAAHAQYRSALAAAIRAGHVDEAALTPPAPEAHAAHVAAEVAALDTLHATLTPAQRAALVAAVEAKFDRHGSGAPGPHPNAGPLRLFAGLGLTEEQQNAVHAALNANRPDAATVSQRFAAVKAYEQAKLSSFASDTFDATSFVAPPPGAVADGPKAGPFLRDLSIVVPLLTASQREQLAQRIEAGPPGQEPPSGP